MHSLQEVDVLGGNALLKRPLYMASYCHLPSPIAVEPSKTRGPGNGPIFPTNRDIFDTELTIWIIITTAAHFGEKRVKPLLHARYWR